MPATEVIATSVMGNQSVGVHCTVIPDGVVNQDAVVKQSKDSLTVRVSVVLTPFRGNKRFVGNVQFPIDQWVNEVSLAASRGIRVFLHGPQAGEIKPADGAPWFVDINLRSPVSSISSRPKTEPEFAQKLWEETFRGPETHSPYLGLIQALDEAGQTPAPVMVPEKASISVNGVALEIAGTRIHRTSEVITTLESLKKADLKLALDERVRGNSGDSRFSIATNPLLALIHGKLFMGPGAEGNDPAAQLQSFAPEQTSSGSGLDALQEKAHFARIQATLKGGCVGPLPATDSVVDASLNQWIATTMTGPTPLPAPDFFLKLWEQIKGFRNRPFRRPLPKDALLSPKEAAARKLSGLAAHPTLAKFLRLIYDIEVEIPNAIINALPLVKGSTARRGYISAVFADAATNPGTVTDPTVTAFVIERKLAPAESRFEPCARGDGPGPDGKVPLRGGFVHLQADDGSKPRFKLMVTERSSAVLGSMNHEQARQASVRAGDSDSENPASLPELQSMGISLLDLQADQAAVASQVSALLRQTRQRAGVVGDGGDADPGATKALTLYAEDLVLGYRVDVERRRNTNKTVGAPEWRTITSCDRLYRDIFDAFRQDYPQANEDFDWHPYVTLDKGANRHFRERDDGYISSGKAIQRTKAGFAALADERMFTWSGDSLGVPGEQLKGDKQFEMVDLNPDYDLAIDQEFRMAVEPARLVAALRESDLYRFALRARYRNGGGPKFDATCSPPDDCVLGSGSNPYPFSRPEVIKAPLVLLPDDDASWKVEKRKQPGSQWDLIVLRSDDDKRKTKKVERIVVPPSCSFTRAEQQKQFDTDKHEVPPGAFEDIERLADGSFPIAQLPDDEREMAGHGLLYKEGSSNSPVEPYYPDANAGNLGVAFVRAGKIPAGFSELSDEVEFWAIDQLPVLSKAIRLKFLAADTMKEGGSLGSLQKGSDELDVTIAKAEEVELHLWCYPDWTRALQSNLFFNAAVQQTADRGRISGWGIGAGKIRGPLPGFNTVTKLKIVHAVPRPLAAPQFVVEGKTLSFALFQVTEPQKWPKTQTDEVGGKYAFVSGKVAFHRRSTRELRCETAWLNFNDPAAVRKENGKWIHAPRPFQAELFSLKQIPAQLPGDGDPDVLELDRDEFGNLRQLSYLFDGRARLIMLRLVAASRFTQYFSLPGDPVDPTNFETASCRREELDPANRLNGSPAGSVFSYWLKATNPPPAVVVDSVDVLLTEIELAKKGDQPVSQVILKKSGSKFRVWLSTWYESGQGELLAVVCVPGNLVDLLPATGFVDAPIQPGHELDDGERVRRDKLERMRLGDLVPKPPAPLSRSPIADVVTGWGTNPTYESGRLTSAIPPSFFGGYVAKVPNFKYRFRVPAPDDAEGAPSVAVDVEVSLVCYEPKIDSQTGRWYVDLDLEPGSVDTPFVRLCLARFQPNAIDECKLSPHLALPPRGVHPSRTVTVKYHPVTDSNSDQYRLEVQVVGPGYRLRHPDRSPDLTDEKLRSLADTPLQNFYLRRDTRRSENGYSSIQAFDEDAAPLVARWVPGVVHPAGLSWSTSFLVPTDTPIEKYMLSIHETELVRLFDSADADLEIKPLVETPRIFACDIPL